MTEPKAPPSLGDGVWQRLCTEKLMNIIELHEDHRAAAWSEARKELIPLARRMIAEPRERRIIIADAQLKKQNLKGFDFSYCYVVRTRFDGATLRDSNFTYAMLRDCVLKDADVGGAIFALTDLKATYVDNLKHDSRTRLHFARFDPSGFVSPQLKDRIDKDRLVASTRSAPVLIRFLNLLTGYGFGLGRFLLLCAGLVLAFALGYWWITPADFAIGAGTSTPDSLSF